MKWFKCHCCEEMIEGKPDIKVAMFLGIAWNTTDPQQYMDFCQECSFTFLRKYRECRTERLKDTYEKQTEAWILEKLKMVKTERSLKQCRDHRQPLAGYSVSHAHLANVRKHKEKRSARVVTRKCGQMEHSFSGN